MAQRIVGLDIGAYSIKAVILESSFRGWELVGFNEMKVSSEYVQADSLISQETPLEEEEEDSFVVEDDTEEESDAPEEETSGDEEKETAEPAEPVLNRKHLVLQHLVRKHGADWEAIYTAIDGDRISLKLISQPFTEQKQIDPTLGHALGDVLPFSLEDKVFDYQILSKAPGDTLLLVGIVDRQHMIDYLEDFRSVGKDPKAVIIDSIALGNLFEQLPIENATEGSVALIDFGHRKTTICVMRKGHMAFVRTIPIGGQDITQALAKKFDYEFEEAERLKHLQGYAPSSDLDVLEDADPQIPETIESALRPLLLQIRLSLHAFRSRSKEDLDTVYITGGASRLGNLEAHLTESLGVPTRTFQYLQSDFDRLADSKDVEAEMTMGLGMAFSGLQGSRLKRLNLRKGDLAFKGDFDLWKGRIAHIAISMTVIFAFFLVNIWSQFHVLGSEDERMSQSIAQTCQKILGIQVADPKICISQMMEVIGKESTGGSKLKPEISHLTLYDELVSRLMKDDTQVDVSELEIAEKKIKIKGEVDAIPTVGTIVENIKGYNCFRNINQGPTGKSVRGDKTQFSLNIPIDCVTKK